VLGASDQPGIMQASLAADGRYAKILNVPAQIADGKIQGQPFVHMDGPAVFKFAVKALSEIATKTLTQAGVEKDQLDWLVPHQANLRIIESTARHLGLPMERVVVTLPQHGNTSAASIPLALDAAVRDGRIQRGHKVLLEGIGGGFSWGAVLLTY
jgi:3-oxoacyl-[acyl-carrier-protein] synthase-3